MDQAKKRKIAARVIGAPLLIATLLFLAWLDHRNGEVVAIRFLIAALSGLGMIEFLQMVRKKGYPVVWSPCIPLLVLPALPWSWILGMSVPEFFFPAALFFVASLFFHILLRRGEFSLESAGCALLGFFYLGALQIACHAPPAIPVGMHIWFLLFLVATNKGSDMAAYVAGNLLGKRKLAPDISPSKTWEGAIAGAIVGTGTGFLVLKIPLQSLDGLPDWSLMGFALLVTISAQVGDLVESAIKRWAGAKDSGHLIPEFGGILDMIDSFLVSIPVAYVGAGLLLWMFS